MNRNKTFSTACRASNRLWQYMLVAHPGDEVQGKVLDEKRFYFSDHGSIANPWSGPSIVFAEFLAKEEMEETLVRWIQNICKLQEAFTVTLNNYSGIPNHTIFLRIQDPAPFSQMTRQLGIIDGFIQSNDCPPVLLRTKPYLALAAGLADAVYDEAIKEYAQRSFHASFILDKMILIRKSWEGGSPELVNTFNLSSQRSS